MCRLILIHLPVGQYVKPALAAAFACFLGIACSLPQRAQSAEPPLPPRSPMTSNPKELIDFKYEGRNDHDYFGPYLFHLLDVKRNESKNWTVNSLAIMFTGSFPVKRSNGDDTPADFFYSLGPIAEGQVIPVMGSAYELLRIERHRVEMKLADAQVLKEAKVFPGSIAVPTVDYCTALEIELFRYWDPGDKCGLAVQKIMPGTTAAEKPTAAIVVTTEEPVNSSKRFVRTMRQVKRELTISVGDTIPLTQGCELLVRNIVPADPNRKIIGWVEFFPKGESKGNK